MGSFAVIGGNMGSAPKPPAMPPPPPNLFGPATSQFGPTQVGRDPRLALTEAGIKQKRVTLPNGRSVLAGYTDADMARARELGVAPGQAGNQAPLGAAGTAASGTRGGGGGGGRGGAGGGAGSGGGGGGGTISSQLSPALRDQLKRYADRFNVDTTERAIDDSTLGTMDAAALGAADSKAGQAGRGILGTSTGASYERKHFYDPAQRQAAANAAGIAIQRQKDLDNLVLGGTSLVTAPDAIASDQARLALEQQQQTWNQNFQTTHENNQNDQQQYEDFMRMYAPFMYGQYGAVPPTMPAY